MICNWNSVLEILPFRFRREVDRMGKEYAQEIRLRLGCSPEIRTQQGFLPVGDKVCRDDLYFTWNAASRYSPWNASTSAQGYITALGGHRIGVCGDAVIKNGEMVGIREIYSVCIRVARDFPGIAKGLKLSCSSLIIGPPGFGKTTLLRDLVRLNSECNMVAVVDERGELYPANIPRGKRIDVLTGCPKIQGIEITLRTMGPDMIAVDEITSEADAAAIVQASNCGVKLLATAHAFGREDLVRRKIYREMMDQDVFEQIVLLHRDGSWHREGVYQ